MSDAPTLPAWAETMRAVFRGGTISQFLLHGNVFDLVPHGDGTGTRFVPLAQFLTEVLFEPFDVVLFYNRGKGIRCAKGEPRFQEFLTGFDHFNQTTYATIPLSMPKDPRRALELLDRFLLYALHRLETRAGAATPAPIRTAVVVEHAEFVTPQGEAIQLASDLGEAVIRLLDWAADPAILGANIATVLISENLRDLHRLIVESPYVAKVRIDLPGEAEAAAYLAGLERELPAFPSLARLPAPALAKRAVGLSRVNLRSLVTFAVQNQKPLDADYFTRTKRELIEKECLGLLEFIESPLTLDAVSGHAEAKAWLRQDAELLRRGETAALPMG
jgi:hypothetical protein